MDADGNAYIAGGTHSSDFPTTAASFDSSYNGSTDTFVVKLDAAGSALVYGTFLGASAGDVFGGITIDDVGNAYLTGWTASSDFPVTSEAFDTVYNGGAIDVYVVKIIPDGADLAYATFLGSSGTEFAYGIALDTGGNAYITGSTEWPDFPTTPGSFDETYNGEGDAFVTKFSADGSAIVYSTYLGGADGDGASGIAVDSAGNAYVGGGTSSNMFPTTPGAYDTSLAIGPGDGFVTKLHRSGRQLMYSTLFGGDDGEGLGDLAVDQNGLVYVIGGGGGTSTPTTPDAFDKTHNGAGDALLIRLNAAGSVLLYSTFLGGSNSDTSWGMAADGAGNLYLAGQTSSNNFPTTPNAVKRRNRDNTIDGFVTKFANV